LARDRIASLTVTAAMRGLIDFREADPKDRRWWFRLRMALDHLEAEILVNQHRLYYDYSLAVLSRAGLTEQSRKQFTQEAERHLFAMVGLWRPWEDINPGRTAQTDRAKMREDWVREFGCDPSAPEGAAAIAETVRLLEKLDCSRRPVPGPAHG
jgi:hypothetical protein